MKRVVFGSIIAMSLASCGGETETADEVDVPEINTEAVVDMENSAAEVEKGMNELEESMNELTEDVDSLLNGI